ncbi:hypothetical protein A2U01_0018250 [Trifolium medium]|uniref:Uncharacterized protein n=1 Tax=Trifolium medium TaxID=97028 RepID=A0A392NBM5_9FABA|nr:hypothetical protein [Trifolium medium]
MSNVLLRNSNRPSEGPSTPPDTVPGSGKRGDGVCIPRFTTHVELHIQIGRQHHHKIEASQRSGKKYGGAEGRNHSSHHHQCCYILKKNVLDEKV